MTLWDITSDFQANMGFDPNLAHLNNAGVAPLSQAARKKALEVLRIQAERGTHAIPELIALYEEARKTLAQFLGVEASQVAFTSTCAASISQVALGLKFNKGDEILLLDQEYPSNYYPWLKAAERFEAKLVMIPSPPDQALAFEALLTAIGPKTKLVSVSWVQFQSGWSLDLKLLSQTLRQQNPEAWLVVDVIQGLGVLPFNMAELDIDAVCGGFHKWLCGPMGLGFLALKKNRLQALEPLLWGAFTVGTSEDPLRPEAKPRLDARRFEPGSPNLINAIAGAGSLEMLTRLNVEAIRSQCLQLKKRLIEGLSERSCTILSPHVKLGANEASLLEGQDSPIVTFIPKNLDLETLEKHLHNNLISFSRRAGGIRLSPHGFNTLDEIQRFFIVMDELLPETRAHVVTKNERLSDQEKSAEQALEMSAEVFIEKEKPSIIRDSERASEDSLEDSSEE